MIYAAVGSSQKHQAMLRDYPAVLYSIAFAKRPDLITAPAPHIIIDSGAFSAWSTGAPMHVDTYSRWIAAADFPDAVYVNLDVIPGEKGRTATRAERLAGMDESIANADALRSRHPGIRLMEVYHQDEPPDFLDRLVERLGPRDVLGISPRNDLSTPARTRWLDAVFARIGSSYPTHGLGVSSGAWVVRYPWRSVDSSTWTVPTRMGQGLSSTGMIQRNFARRGTTRDRASAADIVIAEFLDQWKRIAAAATEAWSRRGVTWEQ